MSVESLKQSHAVAIVADFDEVYNQFKVFVSGKELSPQNIVLFIMDAIRVVEEVTKDSGDKGAAKKALALRLVERLIDELPIEPKTRKQIRDALNSVGPSVIDALIAADRGELLEKGKKLWARIKSLFTACCAKK